MLTFLQWDIVVVPGTLTYSTTSSLNLSVSFPPSLSFDSQSNRDRISKYLLVFLEATLTLSLALTFAGTRTFDELRIHIHTLLCCVVQCNRCRFYAAHKEVDHTKMKIKIEMGNGNGNK